MVETLVEQMRWSAAYIVARASRLTSIKGLLLLLLLLLTRSFLGEKNGF
jgi:hypothetical protein